MSDPSQRRLPVGRIAGHRGRDGELTVRVFDGDAGFWGEVREVWIEAGSSSRAEAREVRSARAYRDRLVLRLAGIDDASAAAALKGRRVTVEPDAAPKLPAGAHYRAALVEMEVWDGARRVGTVVDCVPTAGHDLLVIRAADDPSREILVPWTEAIVENVDVARSVIRIRAPEGLLDLDREDEG